MKVTGNNIRTVLALSNKNLSAAKQNYENGRQTILKIRANLDEIFKGIK